MNAADAELSRFIRREFAKRPVDITRLDIQCVNGNVSLGGVITNLRDQPLVDVREEIAIIDKMMLRHNLVRQYSNLARVIQQGEGEVHDTNTRGRMRPGHS